MLTTSWPSLYSKMINLSQADTIDERVINTKKCTQFTMTVSALTFETQQIVKSKSLCLKITLNGSISLTRWVLCMFYGDTP